MIDINPSDLLLVIILCLEPILIGGLIYGLFSKKPAKTNSKFSKIAPPPKPKYYGANI